MTSFSLIMILLKRTGNFNMCLSTVYSNEMSDDRVIMKNVMSVDCSDTQVTLTDLMGRKVTVDGRLLSANLTDGYVILKTA